MMCEIDQRIRELHLQPFNHNIHNENYHDFVCVAFYVFFLFSEFDNKFVSCVFSFVAGREN